MNKLHRKTLKLILFGLFIAGILLSLSLLHQFRVTLLAENKSLKEQAERLLQLTEENKRLSDLLASTREAESLDKMRMSDLLRLRDEVGRLKKQILSATNQPTTFPPLQIEDAHVEDVIRLLGDASGRILLRPSNLPDVRITLYAFPTNSTEATVILENALAEKGITSISDGEKFLIVVPSNQAGSIAPHSPRGEVSPTRDTSTAGGDPPIPAGEGNDVVSANILVQVYADLTGRKLIPNSHLPSDQLISLRQSIPLTKAEAIYAVEVVLALNNIKVAPVGDDSIEVIVKSQAK
jgi:hypothetical protein